MSENKFRTKARAIELLGRKQIRDDITALIELMKNAYDADAEYLAVEFFLKEAMPYAIIYDTGKGMTEDDILNKWLVIGTDSKRQEKGLRLSESKKRPLMGEKGIGRLASAAIGEQLWIFSKAKKEKWHILYLNWNIFENVDMFLDDVSIPLITGKSSREVASIAIIEEMKRVQKENIMNSAWLENKNMQLPKERHVKLYKTIERQIKMSFIPSRLQEIIDYVDQEIGHGTILLVQNLRLQWSIVFDKTKDRETDLMATQRYNRLGAFVDQFAHTSPDFEVQMFVDNEIQEFNHYIEEEIFEIYDIKIKGEIKGGKFFGQLFALNADQNILNEYNKELKSGIDVTAGIINAAQKDCGPFQVEFCHIENDLKNTGISEEQWRVLQSRLTTVGGIKVFRDGVRVLPYGDPENDFLDIEQRHSKHAGDYLFSHRSLFGRIFLTSINNPELEDKSSREGLLENEKYHYFNQTLQNLLVTIARSYLTGARKESKNLRKTYIEYNQAQMKKKKEEEETLAREKKEFDEYLKNLNIHYKASLRLFSELKVAPLKYFSPNITQDPRYSILMNDYMAFQSVVKEQKKELEENRNHIFIHLNPRFKPGLPESLVQDIEDLNFELNEFINNRFVELNSRAELVNGQFLERLNKWRKEVSGYLNVNDIDRYQSSNIARINILDNQLGTTCNNFTTRINALLECNLERLNKFSKVRDYLNESKQKVIGQALQQQSELQSKMSKAKQLLDNLYSASPSEVHQIDLEINNILSEAETLVNILESEISENLEKEFTKSIEKYVLDALTEVSMVFNISTQNENIIGLLKEQNDHLQHENEVFADMANVGIAAEIVNHEFNQLFVNVNDGLKNLKATGLVSSQIYWVNQIDAGFKAISSRYSQLSPMYRSYNLPKKVIRVKDLVENITDFFASRLTKNHIEIQNLVDSDFKLKLSTSKIYPVLSNLIDNSIYWVLNKPVRIICIWSDVPNRILYIEDSGPGVNPRISKKVFDPFFSTRHGGRGLGLTIVKKVLESQQHEIRIIEDKSIKHLEGACFAIKFACDDGSNENAI